MLELVGPLPDLTQTDSHMESVEDGEGHGDVGDDSPCPNSVVIEEGRVGIGTTGFESADGPHCQVADEEECHLTANRTNQ